MFWNIFCGLNIGALAAMFVSPKECQYTMGLKPSGAKWAEAVYLVWVVLLCH